MGRAKPARDRRAEWLLDRWFAGDADKHQRALEHYRRWRDQVLDNAAVGDGDTLLDVGAGEGPIAFGALDLVGEEGRVIFSDTSQDLLDHSRRLAEEMGVAHRCDFMRASTDDLSALADASVDAVTTRSVLIHVKDERRAFEEFRRVLRPGRRISVWEPINSFTYPEPAYLFQGYDVTPVRGPAGKVKNANERIQPVATDPMLDFDGLDLLALAEEVGFAGVHLDYEVKIAPSGASGDAENRDWTSFARISGNPTIPNGEGAMDKALPPEEAERFAAHMRPLVEEGRGTERWAVARLWAVR